MRRHPRGLQGLTPVADSTMPAPGLNSGLLSLFVDALLARDEMPDGPGQGVPTGVEEMVGLDLRPAHAGARSEHPARRDAPVWPSAPEDALEAVAVEVSGVRIVAPLAQVQAVIDVPRSPSRLPGTGPWIIGVIRHRGRCVRLVDTAAALGIEAGGPAGPQRRALLVGDWGLVFDGGDILTRVEPGDLRWRAARPISPWMAGTVVSLMSPLLDVDALTGWLESGSGRGDWHGPCTPVVDAADATAF